MTIDEALHKIDEVKPNSYTDAEKIAWLNTIDGMIKRCVLDAYTEEVEFEGYDENTDRDTELLVYAPFDDLYIPYLESKIDYFNGEYTKYNNSVTHYNELQRAFDRDYNRTHTAKKTNLRFK